MTPPAAEVPDGVVAARTARPALEAMGVARFAPDNPETAELVERHSWPRTYVVGRSSVLTDEPLVAYAALGLVPAHMVIGAFERVSELEPLGEFRMAYLAACHDVGRRVFADLPRAAELAEHLEALVSSAHFAGLPLAAGWASTPRPSDVGARIERAATVLRELRGGLHLSVLVSHGLLGAEALLLHALWRSADPERLLRFFGWRERDAIDAAWEILIATGRVQRDRVLTEVGRAERADIELRTDELAAQPWNALDPEQRQKTIDLLAAAHTRIS